MIIKIEKMDHQGRGIAYLEKPIFIDNTLIDEIVDIDILSIYKKYMIGKVNKYIKVSKKRVEALCPYYNECGGCQLMHIDYNEQLNYKKNKVKDIIYKYVKEDIVVRDIIESKQIRYRNKITFQVGDQIGFYKKSSNELVAIDDCLLADNKIIDKLKNISSTIRKNKLVIKCGENVVTNLENKDLEIKLNDLKFYVPNDAFFQVNTEQTIKLYDKIIDYLLLEKTDNVLDLYCGVGSIGIYLSFYCNYVYGVEINESSIKGAIKNKEINNIDNITFKCLDAKYISNMNYDVNKVVVDPPRSGLDKKTVKFLLDGSYDKIVYVSCDPMTLARDLNLLKDKYNILEITPVDMFPNTYHVECVCLLEIK